MSKLNNSDMLYIQENELLGRNICELSIFTEEDYIEIYKNLENK